VISGTPTASGTFTFTVKATNDAGFDTKAFSITVVNATTGDTGKDSNDSGGSMMILIVAAIVAVVAVAAAYMLVIRKR
jgi:hypothetical protein